MRRFVYIKYFQGFPHLHFAGVESVKGSVKAGIEDIRAIENTKVGGVLRGRCVDKTSWYLGLLYIFSEVSFVSLLKFLSVSITRL